MTSTEHKDPERVVAGLKAAIHNPNVSSEAKEQAAERLVGMEGKGDVGNAEHHNSSATTEMNRVLGGYKSTLHNEHTSPEAKKHAAEVLEAAGYHIERPHDVSEEDHRTRVLAGYKAALSNPRVSPEAKLHAEEFLKAHNAL